MTLQLMMSGVLGMFLLCTVCGAETGTGLKDEQSRINYSIGYQIGNDFKKQGWTLDSRLLVQGIQDALKNSAPLMSSEQMNMTLVKLKKKLTDEQPAGSKQKDDDFLKANALKKGVVVLPSGVQYNVIRAGTGKQPALKDSVIIKFHVSRVTGKEIASAYPDSAPRTYPMKKALPGLQEVLQLMKEGSVWRVILPPSQQSGSKGEALEKVGVLVYSLELVSVKTGI